MPNFAKNRETDGEGADGKLAEARRRMRLQSTLNTPLLRVLCSAFWRSARPRPPLRCPLRRETAPPTRRWRRSWQADWHWTRPKVRLLLVVLIVLLLLGQCLLNTRWLAR